MAIIKKIKYDNGTKDYYVFGIPLYSSRKHENNEPAIVESDVVEPAMVEPDVVEQAILDPNVNYPQHLNHDNFLSKVVELGNFDGFNVLEIGSRIVTSDTSYLRSRLTNCNYVGFDYYKGDNVDVVGDVHKLSSYFKEGEQFDIICTSACFEHFAMPWVVAEEIAKLLKVGGHILIETHFSYSSHERPWHFFQFSDMALKVLFSPALGFKCIDAGMCNPISGAKFSIEASSYLQGRPIHHLYCHSDFWGTKEENINSFDWHKVNLNDVVNNTHYPKKI